MRSQPATGLVHNLGDNFPLVRIVCYRRSEVIWLYCTSQDVKAPIELYDRVHAAVKAQVGDRDVGLLVHLARQIPGGFSVIEIWRSKDDYDRAMVEILMPMMREAVGAHGAATVPPITEFEPRGLIIQAAGVYI